MGVDQLSRDGLACHQASLSAAMPPYGVRLLPVPNRRAMLMQFRQFEVHPQLGPGAGEVSLHCRETPTVVKTSSVSPMLSKSWTLNSPDP